MPATIRFQTLGTIDLRAGDAAVSSVLSQPKRLAILAYLACARPAGYRSRDTLLALFWPESDTERARNSLRQALHHLRRGVGDGAITTRGEREVGIDGALVWCDAALFDAAIAEGRLEDALTLYAGDFLPGLHVQEAPEAERWLDDERLHRRREALGAARKLADRAAGAGDLDAAVRWARRAVTVDATDEGAVRRLLELLAEAGDVSGALDAYADFAKRLDADFGLKPSREMTRLVQSLSERPSATTAEMRALSPSESRAAVRSATRDAAPVAPPGVSPPAPAAAPVEAAAPGATTAASPAQRSPFATAPASPTPGDSPSIAVLPFVNMSGDPGNEYLSDGLTEELLNRLAQFPDLRVAARTSAFSFKNRNVPIDSIGRVLRVRHVLEGSLRQSGARWRITAQLIDASTGYHLWSENFETSLDDVVAVQDSISRAIVDQLLARVGATARRNAPPRDAEAHVASMKGWRAFRTNTPDGYAAAIAHFRSAIARDSAYGYAWAGLATVRHWQGFLRWADRDSAYDDAFVYASRALALDSTLVDGWLILGRNAEVREQDERLAEQHYRRAMRVAPNDPRPYSRLAPLVLRKGGDANRRDALALAQKAVSLDIASPAVYADLANLHTELNDYREAERALRQALTLDPGHPILLGNLALLLSNQRNYVAAESMMVRLRSRVPADPVALGQHAFIAARLGKRDAARALADTAERLGLSKVALASTYVVIGDTTAMYRLLDQAVRDGDDRLDFLLDSTNFVEVREQPHFARLLDVARRKAGAR
ncbi:MAG TPA: BTAD domain-containing putative transcriptional regulator [Gemmatimonadaceae bacterium]|nr:BTAD domain-containing putative transcriptional regulator [Gemmatimonadaceae bacterium]